MKYTWDIHMNKNPKQQVQNKIHEHKTRRTLELT